MQGLRGRLHLRAQPTEEHMQGLRGRVSALMAGSAFVGSLGGKEGRRPSEGMRNFQAAQNGVAEIGVILPVLEVGAVTSSPS